MAYNRKVVSDSNNYEFTNIEDGMLIEKNNTEVGVYPGFVCGDNLDDNYLVELAQEFEI